MAPRAPAGAGSRRRNEHPIGGRRPRTSRGAGGQVAGAGADRAPGARARFRRDVAQRAWGAHDATGHGVAADSESPPVPNVGRRLMREHLCDGGAPLVGSRDVAIGAALRDAAALATMVSEELATSYRGTRPGGALIAGLRMSQIPTPTLSTAFEPTTVNLWPRDRLRSHVRLRAASRGCSCQGFRFRSWLGCAACQTAPGAGSTCWCASGRSPAPWRRHAR